MAILMFSLSGCGIAYNIKRNEMLKTATEADFGPRPPSNYQETEKQMILDTLKDPDSAKFKFVEKIENTTIQKGFGSPTPILVWISEVWVNAKNSYGGYTGEQRYLFAWKDGKIIATSSPDSVMWKYLP
jgi:hypothetical protein